MRVELRVTNDGEEPIHYSGYARTHPLYTVFRLQDGAWRRATGGWCGTGLGPRTLEPAESVEFAVRVHGSWNPFRVEILLRTPEPGAEPRVVRTPPVH